ncbi:MAG: tripartite tricarboxylate transporter permease [Spirochaetaceae bacterium]
MFGVTLGIIMGAIPGLTATMGIALMLPLSIRLETATGMGLLLGVYCGAIIGASIPAILLGIPGNPNAIATVYDGYAMTQSGRGAEALGGAVVASFIGGMISLALLALFAPAIARFTLEFGPPERTALALVGIAIIASVSSKSLAKGLLTGAFGISLALVGPDTITQALRMPFPALTAGTPLAGGIKLIPALIGLFGISQAIYDLETIGRGHLAPPQIEFKKLLPHPRVFLRMWRLILESTGIGTLIGAIPGTGASIAVFLSYQRAQRVSGSKKNDLNPIGSGRLEGVVAPEAANNAVSGGALIPALALGIPGDAATAVLLGALLIRGVTPGYQLFSQDIGLVYGIFIALFFANVFMVIFQMAGIRIFPRVLSIPSAYLLPLIIVFSLIGSYAIEGRAILAASFNMGVAMVLGILGYFLKKHDYPIAPIVLGLILGGMFEHNLRLSIRLARGDYTVFLQRPISALLIVFAVLSVVFSLWSNRRSSIS